MYEDFHTLLVKVYSGLGFNLIEVLRVSVEDRAEFVLKNARCSKAAWQKVRDEKIRELTCVTPAPSIQV
jgi:hypothetical protein